MKKTPDKGVALLVKAATEKEDRQVLALIKRGSSLPQAVCYAARIRNRAAPEIFAGDRRFRTSALHE